MIRSIHATCNEGNFMHFIEIKQKQVANCKRSLFWSCGGTAGDRSFSNECRTDICHTTGYPRADAPFCLHKKVSRAKPRKKILVAEESSTWIRYRCMQLEFVPHSTCQRFARIRSISLNCFPSLHMVLNVWCEKSNVSRIATE